MALDLQIAIDFLRNQMYNTTDQLVRESTKPEGNNYYIHSANGLYYSVMIEEDEENAELVLETANKLRKRFAEDQILNTGWYYLLTRKWRKTMHARYSIRSSTGDTTWTTLENGDVRINLANGSTKSPSDNNLNTKCLYIIKNMAEYRKNGNITSLNTAKSIWTDVVGMFDDDLGGYVDSQEDYRESYKQALVKICGEFKELKSIGTYQEATGMWDSGLQGPNGGIYMHYIRNESDEIVNNGSTFENTEVTCATILAHRSSPGFFG